MEVVLAEVMEVEAVLVEAVVLMIVPKGTCMIIRELKMLTHLIVALSVMQSPASRTA